MTVNLTDYWGVDRSPGGGKTIYATLGDATTEAPITPVTGIGGDDPDIGVDNDETTWPPLLEPGEPLAPPGDPNRDRGLIAFRRATGFNGNSILGPIPSASDGFSWSFSCWLNFGVTNTPGFTPDPLQGYIMLSGGAILGLMPDALATSYGNGIPGISFYDNILFPFAAIDFPTDSLVTTGWFHLMMSQNLRRYYTLQIDPFIDQTTIISRYVAYINDTEILNDTETTTVGGDRVSDVVFHFSNTTANGVGGYTSDPPAGNGMYAAVTELWEKPNRFIDWSVKANREKFHTSDSGWGVANTTYAPVDIGRSGRRPGFGAPRLYLTGGPSIFRRNRAVRGAPALTLNGDDLVAIDDPPGGV